MKAENTKIRLCEFESSRMLKLCACETVGCTDIARYCDLFSSNSGLGPLFVLEIRGVNRSIKFKIK